MCILHPDVETVEPFNYSLCTQGVLSVSVECNESDDICKLSNSPELERAIEVALTHLPNDLGILLDVHSLKDFLFGEFGSKLRRTNTINELVTFLEDNFLTFILTTGTGIGKGYSEEEQSSYFSFLQELSEKLHDRNCYLGQDFGQRKNDITPNFNVTEVAKVVDWFTIAPYQMLFDGTLQPYTPLTMYRDKPDGSTKYWIEKLLRLVKPECLVVDVGPLLHKQRARETAVEPGPGSKDSGSGKDNFDISSVCYNLQRLANDCREYWDEQSDLPWAVCGNDYYSFENVRSLKLKIELLQRYNISGVMFWTDDITPKNGCNNGDPFALLRAVQGIRQKR